MLRTALDYMIAESERSTPHFVMVLPDVIADNGKRAMYRYPYRPYMASMLSEDPAERAAAFIGFAWYAHREAKRLLGVSE